MRDRGRGRLEPAAVRYRILTCEERRDAQMKLKLK
jgi:hypothetical protein